MTKTNSINRSLVLMLTTTMIFLILFSGIGAAATTYYVNESESIQTAINAAASGDTIYVYNGTYLENISIGKPLTLIGEDRSNTTIDSEGSQNTVNISSSNVNVTGFTIQNASDWSPNVNISGDGSLENVEISNNIIDGGLSVTRFGINANNVNLIIVENNEIHGNKYGIFLNNSDNGIISDNNASYNNLEGIYLVSSSNNTLTGNTANNSYYGIHLYDSSNNNLASNTASDNADGIYLSFSSNNNNLTSNTANNNSCGIYLEVSSNNNTLTDNTAKSNTEWDFDSSWDSINNTVTNLDIGSVISFTGKDISLKSASAPASDPSGYGSIDKFINATNNSADSWLFMNVSYVAEDMYGINESSAKIWRYNSTASDWEAVVDTNGVNTADKYIYANITSFSIFAPFAEIRSPIYVPADYVKIQAAIDASLPGDTIYVDSGTYLENISMGKPLTLIGEDRSNTTIDSKNSSKTVNISSSNVMITGFTIQNASTSNVYIGTDGSLENVEISNNIIDGESSDSESGIHTYYVNLLTVQNNEIHGNNYGIYLDFSDNGIISDNNVSDNDYEGINLLYSRNNTLTGNNANNNSNGIHLGSLSNNNTLIGNNANYNINNGIVLSSSNNSTLTGNNANNNDYGIFLDKSNNSKLTGNNASDNINGIYLSFSSNNTFTSNTANNNTDFGIYLSLSNNNNLTGNTANLNDNYGIFIKGSSNNNLTSNTANFNYYGIFLDESSSDNTLTDNTAKSNTEWDFYSESNSINNTVTNLDIGSVISFTGKDISIKSASSPASDPSSYYNLGKYINATNNSVDSWMFMNVSYSASDISGLNENSLIMWKHDGAAWSQVSGENSVNAAENYVYANITTFSIFAPMGKKAPVKDTSSSSGGGGGGSSGEKYENIEVKEVVREYIVINEETTYEFNEELNSIETIKFTALKNSGAISATIEVLKGRSALVKNDPPGQVYQNMNIWVGKSGFATSNNIADVRVGFKVEKSWIEANGIVVSTIKLCRNHDDVWNPLPTKKSGEDDKYIYFETNTPGFSPFSIISSAEEEIAVVDDITIANEVSGDTEPVTQSDDGSDTEEEASGLPGFSIIMGILGIVSAILVRRK